MRPHAWLRRATACPSTLRCCRRPPRTRRQAHPSRCRRQTNGCRARRRSALDHGRPPPRPSSHRHRRAVGGAVAPRIVGRVSRSRRLSRRGRRRVRFVDGPWASLRQTGRPRRRAASGPGWPCRPARRHHAGRRANAGADRRRTFRPLHVQRRAALGRRHLAAAWRNRLSSWPDRQSGARGNVSTEALT